MENKNKYLNFKKEIVTKFTKNFAFRDFALSDIYPYFNANKNELFNKFLLTSKPQDIETIKKELIDKSFENYNLNTGVTITIVNKMNGEWVGFLRCYNYKKIIAASLMIDPKYWGTGAAIEIAKSTSQIFLKYSGSDKIYVRILDENKKTLHLNYKIGAKSIEVEKLITADGIEKDCHILEIKKIENEIEIFNFENIKEEEFLKS